MDIYQHDSATTFQFVLRGELIQDEVQELECAWTTAKSILAGKELVVDVSGITNADTSGIDLLSRMRESGARLTAALPPASEEILRSLGVPVAAPSGRLHKVSLLISQGFARNRTYSSTGVAPATRPRNGLVSGQNGAAARSDIKRTTLQSWMKRLKIGREYRQGTRCTCKE